jgi:hypothetical protein
MDIPVWFLILGLLFPRLTLLIAYCNDAIPTNNIPFWGDFMMAVFIPRILISIYIGTTMGCDNVWFIIHVIGAAISFIRGFKFKTSK